MIPRLEKGLFLCSIDTELAWGHAHLPEDPTEYQHWGSYSRVRDTISRLLELMDRHDIRATWAFVGRLLIDPRDSSASGPYPANPQPASSYLSGERLSESDFLDCWYAPEVLDMVRRAKSAHEIGSHTFSHLIADEPGYSRVLLEQDLVAATTQAREMGTELKSFIYPKNRVAHTELLAEQGFEAYRTVPESRANRLPAVLRRVVNRLNAYLPFPPDISFPERDGDLWVLPASLYYRHSGEWARWQSNYVRRSKLKAGLRKAARQLGLFHIWFHPYDVASDPDRLLKPLEAAFVEVSRLRDEGRIDNCTMGETARLLSRLEVQQRAEQSQGAKLPESSVSQGLSG